MNTRRRCIAWRILMTLFVFMTPLCWLVLSEALANDDCGWTLTNAQDTLDDWQVTVGGFHSDLVGENAVSYRDLIKSWGSPDDDNDPAKKLGICALNTFVREINAFPGVKARETELIDSVFEIARSEMLLGTEDFIEVLDQEHISPKDPVHPIASPNAIDEEIMLLEGPATNPIHDPDDQDKPHDLYGNFPQGRRNCIGHYKEAVNVFLKGLSTEAGCAAFANQDFSNSNDELANKSLRAMGLFCRASARKSRAYKELADRQFARDYDRNNQEAPIDAKNTSLLAGQAAYLEAVTIAAVMPEEGIGSLVNSKDFQLISGNILEVENVHSYVTRGSNPFGYKNHYVSFRFDPDIAQTHGHRNNYEQMNYYLTHDRNYVGVAETSINNACGGDSPYMRDRVRGIEKEYNGFQQMVQNETNQTEGVRAQKRLELVYILGYGNCHDGLDNDQDGLVDDCGEELENLGEYREPDQVSCFTNDGEIGQLVCEIKKAKLRIDRIDQDMEIVDSTVKIKSELLARLITINNDQIRERTGIIKEITNEKVKIIKDTGEEMASYAEEEARARAEAAERKGLLNGITGIVSGIAAVGATIATGGAAAPALAAMYNGVGAATPGIGAWIDSPKDADLSRNLGSIQARRERAAAFGRAEIVLQEGDLQIRLSELDAEVYKKRTNAEFEADILTLLLQKELLTIDMLIAEEDVKQVTMRLSAALKRALRLLQDREEFEQRVAQTEELQKFFMDPSARVLEDQLIMKAAEDFRLAAEMVYLTGKAMEYEINDDFPRLDNVFKMRRIDELRGLQQALWDKYYNTPDIWNDEPTPRTLSLRRDLLGLPLAGFDPEADSRFKVFMEQHITQQGDFYIKFDTYLTVGRYDDPWLPPLNFFGQPSVRYNDNFPQDHWNEKIETIRVNINGMQNFDENGVSTSLTHYGISYIRSVDAEIDEYAYIIRDDVKPWNLEARTTGSFVASVNGQLHYPEEYYYNDQLVARSVATSDWRLKIQGRGLANIEDLLTISDIEIIIMSRGYPIQPAW